MSLFGQFPRTATLEVGGLKVLSLKTSSSSRLGDMVASALVANVVNAAVEYVILPVLEGAYDAAKTIMKKS